MTTTTARERPVRFDAHEVRAVLEGRKTQMRLPVTARNSTVLGYTVSAKDPMWTGLVWDERVYADWGFPNEAGQRDYHYLHVPYVTPGDSFEGLLYRVRSRIQPGDHLWVQETWQPIGPWETRPETVQYRADGTCLRKIGWPESFRLTSKDGRHKWRSATQMPRWASRITLEIVRVWVERASPWVWCIEFKRHLGVNT